MCPTKTNSRWSTSIASPSAFMFHKTRNLKDSRRSPASDRLTSRMTFRTGFEKCCHSPSGFCEPVRFVEYALEYFEMSCVVVVIVERDMCVSGSPSFRITIPAPATSPQWQLTVNDHAGVYLQRLDTLLDVSNRRLHVSRCPSSMRLNARVNTWIKAIRSPG